LLKLNIFCLFLICTKFGGAYKVTSIISDTLTGKTKTFSSNISYRKWVVQYTMDKELPTWANDSISYTTHDSRNSSAPEKSLGAFHFGGRVMIIETKSALKLINKYFPNQ
jgi:hypothetical protein